MFAHEDKAEWPIMRVSPASLASNSTNQQANSATFPNDSRTTGIDVRPPISSLISSRTWDRRFCPDLWYASDVFLYYCRLTPYSVHPQSAWCSPDEPQSATAAGMCSIPSRILRSTNGSGGRVCGTDHRRSQLCPDCASTSYSCNARVPH
jgi:hypothetical protein